MEVVGEMGEVAERVENKVKSRGGGSRGGRKEEEKERKESSIINQYTCTDKRQPEGEMGKEERQRLW